MCSHSKKYPLSDSCSENLPRQEARCHDFNECILSAIPNSIMTSEDNSLALVKEPNTNSRRTKKMISCAEGYIPTHKGHSNTTGILNNSRLSSKSLVTCRCNNKAGCFWSPSSTQFDCIKVGSCKNMRKLNCSPVEDAQIRYKKGDDTIALPFALRNGSNLYSYVVYCPISYSKVN